MRRNYEFILRSLVFSIVLRRCCNLLSSNQKSLMFDGSVNYFFAEILFPSLNRLVAVVQH